MGSRETILQSIKSALENGKSDPVLPEIPEVWPVLGKSTELLASEFEKNLTAVAGKVVQGVNRQDLPGLIADRLKILDQEKNGSSLSLGVMPCSETLDLANLIVDYCREKKQAIPTLINAPDLPEDADPIKLASWNASLVFADYLLADTGSAVIRAASAFNRLLCYLSPVCWIIARESTLREHLPHLWPELSQKIDPTKPNAALSGEYLLMTGPSRTADIEKILVLGVHGPREVTVFILRNE